MTSLFSATGISKNNTCTLLLFYVQLSVTGTECSSLRIKCSVIKASGWWNKNLPKITRWQCDCRGSRWDGWAPDPCQRREGRLDTNTGTLVSFCPIFLLRCRIFRETALPWKKCNPRPRWSSVQGWSWAHCCCPDRGRCCLARSGPLCRRPCKWSSQTAIRLTNFRPYEIKK